MTPLGEEDQLRIVALVRFIMPVSYTHLDVYKRQAQGFLKHALDQFSDETLRAPQLPDAHPRYAVREHDPAWGGRPAPHLSLIHI